MAQYTRPATRRSYDAIQADISAAVDALALDVLKITDAQFWQASAEEYERLVNLWNEIVWQVVDDEALPKWTRHAALATRDHYADRAREARRQAGETPGADRA